MSWVKRLQALLKRPPRWAFLVAAVLILSVWTFYLWQSLFSTWFSPSAPLVEVTEPETEKVRSALDGRWEEVSVVTSTLVAVMIDNSAEGRAMQSGLEKARLIWEAPVEGGRSRLLAIFSLADENMTIGPVRSARPYFLTWAGEMNALYAHVGGSDQALADIKSKKIFDLNEFYRGQYFWRDSNRPRPYNVYTDLVTLAKAFNQEQTKQNWQEKELTPWLFKDKKENLPITSTPKAVIGFGPGSVVTWKHSPEKNVYERYLGNNKQYFGEGRVITADNVVVLEAEMAVLDDVGRLRVQTLGDGPVRVYRDGLEILGVWRKNSLSERIRFFDRENKEIVLNAGLTWIEVEWGN